MNMLRRILLNDIHQRVESIKEEIEACLGDEEEYRDNIPENLQGSAKHEAADQACYNLQEAVDDLEYVLENITGAIDGDK